MMNHPASSARPGLRAAHWVACAALLALGACAELPAMPGFAALGGGAAMPPPVAQPVAALPPRAADPVVGFAAMAAPGTESLLILEGRSVRARLQRSYQAASGRECREVLLGSGVEETSALVCRSAEGWQSARPLLRGGGPRS